MMKGSVENISGDKIVFLGYNKQKRGQSSNANSRFGQKLDEEEPES